MSKETHVHLAAGQGNLPTTLVIREGAAETIAYPKGIEITGILAAPFQFYEGKKDLLKPQECHLRIYKDKGAIELHVLDTNARGSGSKIQGTLYDDTVLASWEINTEHRWSVSSFTRHLQMYKSFFADRSECDALIKSLRGWQATVETVIKQHNDDRGNSLSMLEKKVRDVELKSKFTLKIPIFQGYPKEQFTVEIGLDPKSNAVDLYLISEELFALTIDRREAIITTELAKFDEFPCSKVVVS